MRDGGDPSDKPWLAPPETCRQLRQLCESKRTRAAARANHKWHPGSVKRPGSDDYFDTESAWAFIHDCLAGGCEVEVIEMDNPPGKKGFVIFAQSAGQERIYIKLEFARNIVIGRSFHISDEKRREK